RRRPGHPAQGRREMVWPHACAARHHAGCRAGRETGHSRSVGLGQVDADPSHQSAGGAPARQHHGGRHRAVRRPEGAAQHPPRSGHGVPGLSSVSAPDQPGKSHPGADARARPGPRQRRAHRHAVPGKSAHPGPGRQVPEPAVRRAAAARGDRPRPVHAAARH
ncbi:hypothetical protein OY671_011464, partial [Metschnikowia pulcherrima]